MQGPSIEKGLASPPTGASRLLIQSKTKAAMGRWPSTQLLMLKKCAYRMSWIPKPRKFLCGSCNSHGRTLTAFTPRIDQNKI